MFVLAGLCILGALLAGGAAALYVVHYAGMAPPLDRLHPIVPGGNSEVFAADGQRLGWIESDVLRTPVAANEIPTNLMNATVAIEDQRFYKHGGIDLEGILRSAVDDALAGQPLQGGSTLEMQLVRNLYMPASERVERTLKRKIVEAVEADRLEKRYSKQYILTRYLNSVPYGTVGGQNAIGVAAAARVFFNKTVSQLNLVQCALLAGLPQAPSEYNPFDYPAAATQRRNEVLEKMAQLHYISQATANAGIADSLELRHSDYYEQHRESYFFDFVTQQLIDKYGINTVQQGGLKVYTTINLKYQALARDAIAKDLYAPNDPAAAIVTENPRNGYILAMAQSASPSQYNLAAQGMRQPGSTFKPIVLADALTRGIDPNTTYYLSHTLPDGWLPGYPTYNVETFEGVSLNKEVNLVQATLTSDNTVYAQLAADLGEKTVTRMAYAMGVTTHLDSYAAEALGGLTVGVSPLEMANVYSTLADGGYRDKQISITRVVFPDGRVDSSWGKPERVKVLSSAVDAEETTILHENVLEGTAINSAIGCPTAAKTGTTSGLYDAWLDGYNPDFATVVWIGYPNKHISMTDVQGQAQQGAYIPAYIWHDYMSAVVGNHCVPFPQTSQQIQYKPFHGKYQSLDGATYSSSTSLSQFAPTSTVPTAPQSTGPGGIEAPSSTSPTPNQPNQNTAPNPNTTTPAPDHDTTPAPDDDTTPTPTTTTPTTPATTPGNTGAPDTTGTATPSAGTPSTGTPTSTGTPSTGTPATPVAPASTPGTSANGTAPSGGSSAPG